jgi:SAM-dependent methyltransferase
MIPNSLECSLSFNTKLCCVDFTMVISRTALYMFRYNLTKAVYFASLAICVQGWSAPALTQVPLNMRNKSSQRKAAFSTTITTRTTTTSSLNAVAQPFGKQEYWEGLYKEQDAASDFSWYAGWKDLEPFVSEWITPDQKVLIPGVGIDSLITDMYDVGYTQLAAFDYAPESIAHCQRMLGADRKVDLRTADARDLHVYASESFDAVIDKGTLDAVFLAGDDKEERLDSLTRAISELARVLKPGGIFFSLSGICVEPLQSAALWTDTDFDTCCCWEALTPADGSLYTTADGYTSNNVDGTLLVWKKVAA